jgi:hypothetical protein
LKISILFEKNIKNPVALCCVKESILIEGVKNLSCKVHCWIEIDQKRRGGESNAVIA